MVQKKNTPPSRAFEKECSMTRSKVSSHPPPYSTKSDYTRGWMDCQLPVLTVVAKQKKDLTGTTECDVKH